MTKRDAAVDVAFIGGGIVAVLIGVTLMLGLAGYVGLWQCLVGGITDIINQFKAPEASSRGVGIAILKLILTPICVASGFWGGVVFIGAGIGAIAAPFGKKKKKVVAPNNQFPV